MPSDSQRPLSLYRRGGQSPYTDRSDEAQFCTFLSSHLDGSMPSIHTSPTRAKQEEQVKYLPKHTPF